MKKIVFIIFFLTGFIAKSQSIFRWGIVGGINASKIIADTKTKSLNGFHVGLIGEIKTPTHYGFEADVLVSSKGTIIEGVNANLEKTNFYYKLNYLDVPIVIKRYFLKVFNVQAGPQFSYLLTAKASIRYNYGITEIGDMNGRFSILQITLGIWVN